MSKFFWSIATMAVVVTLSMSLQACGDSNDDDNSTIDNGGNSSGDITSMIGFWQLIENTGSITGGKNGYQYFFFEDGVCISREGYQKNTWSFEAWKEVDYNLNTKKRSVTFSNGRSWSFSEDKTVWMLGGTQYEGGHVGKTGGGNIAMLEILLFRLKWTDGTHQLSFSQSGTTYMLNASSLGLNLGSHLSHSYGEYGNMISVITRDSKKYVVYTINVYNPYSYNDVYFTLEVKGKDYGKFRPIRN